MAKLKPKQPMAQSGGSVARKNKTGRKPHVTIEVVERVSERFAMGIPLRLCFALEKDPCVNQASWDKALSRNPLFVRAFEAKKAEFYRMAVGRLAGHDDWRALAWLLERRFGGEFVKPAETLNVSQTIVGVPDDVLARAREYAAKHPKG